MINPLDGVRTKSQQKILNLESDWSITKGQTLQLIQPIRFRYDFLLKSEKKILGRLQYKAGNSIRIADVTIAQTEWKYKFLPLSLPNVTIYKNENLFAHAVLETNWGWQGSLIISEKYFYRWRSIDHTDKELCFLSGGKKPVVFIRPRMRFLRIEAGVEIDNLSLHNPHLPLLTMLGCFLMLLRLG
jgi:hypothetical protein